MYILSKNMFLYHIKNEMKSNGAIFKTPLGTKYVFMFDLIRL